MEMKIYLNLGLKVCLKISFKVGDDQVPGEDGGDQL